VTITFYTVFLRLESLLRSTPEATLAPVLCARHSAGELSGAKWLSKNRMWLCRWLSWHWNEASAATHRTYQSGQVHQFASYQFGCVRFRFTGVLSLPYDNSRA